jgi:phosphoribosylformimino-5-aminoimidazole carboxamide ribotide isomerase
MIIIPAIDLKQGKCVRLLQGRMDQETIFSDAPVDMALRWEREGAEIIHIVDLDGAVQKQPENFNAIKQILEKVKIPVQIGGGIRDENAIKMYLDLGAARVIIGTEAIKNPTMVKKACRTFPGRIIVGIDARNGLVAVEGWTQTTTTRAVDLAKEFEDSGVYAINFTDIHRDGMQTGPNVEETRLLAEAVSIPVVASGGVATIEDIRNLLPLQEVGVTGIIAGRSLYAGTLKLQDAIKLLKKTSLG